MCGERLATFLRRRKAGQRVRRWFRAETSFSGHAGRTSEFKACLFWKKKKKVEKAPMLKISFIRFSLSSSSLFGFPSSFDKVQDGDRLHPSYIITVAYSYLTLWRSDCGRYPCHPCSLSTGMYLSKKVNEIETKENTETDSWFDIDWTEGSQTTTGCLFLDSCPW